MGLKLTTPPTATLVDLATVRRHLRLASDYTAEDTDLTNMVKAATDEAEQLMNRPVLSQGWTLTLDNWYGTGIPPVTLQIYTALPQWRPTVDMAAADAIRINCAGISAIGSVKYVAPDGTLTTMAGGDYIAAIGEFNARLQPAYATAWPTLRPQIDAITIAFTAGWADAASVPEAIKRWVLLRVGSYYDFREQWSSGKPIDPNDHMNRLLDRWCLASV